MNAIILDTETNKLNGYPIEIAYTPCSFEQGVLNINHEMVFDEYFSCPEPISLGAMAVHHILESDIDSKPSYTSFVVPECEYIIGHNIDYDINVIKLCDEKLNVKAICTLALSRMVWGDLDAHNLSAMYYYVMADKELARRHLKNAHNAKADIYFTGVILKHIVEALAIKDMQSLYLFSEQARIPSKIGFGKHKGTPITQLPKDYVGWLLRQPDTDSYLRKALEGCHGLT
ncbi:3'-5' exonuclease [Acinetobacter ursingii]|uniref:3'-5' exonuclease n=1 Tax=Acinetobacter ursingii TaxID=108980 RepID=UPI0030090199